MVRWIALCSAAVLLTLTALPCSTPACSLCDPALRSLNTLREEWGQAKVVLFGTLANPQFNRRVGAPPGSGTTDFHVVRILMDSTARAGRSKLELPKYLPVENPSNPPKCVCFYAVRDGQMVLNHIRPVQSDAVLAYLTGIAQLHDKDRTQQLLFFFNHLDDKDAALAQDAFLEFARCNDIEIGNIAKHLPSPKIQALLKDPKTPPERLGLYAFLAGASTRNNEAAALLRSMIEHPSDRTTKAMDGLLGGYIQLQPREGWDLAFNILADSKKPFTQRIAVMRTLQFYHGWKPVEYQKEIMRCIAVTIADGEIADFGIEDLRQWKNWDLTNQVLAQYGKATHDSPLARRCIIRYALCCPHREAQQFIATLRQHDPELVREVQENLDFEKGL